MSTICEEVNDEAKYVCDCLFAEVSDIYHVHYFLDVAYVHKGIVELVIFVEFFSKAVENFVDVGELTLFHFEDWCSGLAIRTSWRKSRTVLIVLAATIAH